MSASFKECPSCQTMVPILKSLCESCGWRFVEGTVSKPVPVATSKVPTEVEMSMVIDSTGSSDRFSKGIGRMSKGIFERVEAKARSLRVWVQTHGDEDYGQKPVLLTDGGTIEQALADIESIEFEGGGDAEEHHLDGVEAALRFSPWPVDPRKKRAVMICFLTADSKPAKSGRTPEQIGQEICEKKALFYLVSQRTPRVMALCQAAHGMFVEISNDPIESEIEQIASAISQSIVASVATGKTMPVIALGAPHHESATAKKARRATTS